MAMHDLPALPQLNDAQWDAVLEVFTLEATALGLSGPAEAYTQWSMNNLAEKVKLHMYGDMEAEVNAMREAKRAEVAALLQSLGVNP